MASVFSKRTTAQVCINFGIRSVKYTLVVMHREQDETCCSHTLSLTVVAHAEEYKALLVTALYQEELRNVEDDQVDTISKATDPVKFKDERTWPKWEVKFEIYVSTIPGFNGVPLSCVVRPQAYPGCTTYFQGTFMAGRIAFAPLSVAQFQYGTRKVHQLLKNYLVAETAKQWISTIEKRSNGRDNFDTLLRYYSGEDSVSRHVATSD